VTLTITTTKPTEMTNNKQQTAVKLYTEEEIVSFLKREFSDEINAETFMENLTPIELPSDEEIEDASLEENNDDLSPAEEFQRGAKWMRNKIQGGEQ
jgi:hypothetical protein